MSPGYDVQDHADFTRAIPQGCVFCHTAYPRLLAQRAVDIYFFPHAVPDGIGCERCHGPGQNHADLALRGETVERLKQAIYNPARDTKEAQRTVCYQCHMEVSVDSLGIRVVKPGRDIFAFQPGQPFSQYAVQLSVNRSSTRNFEVVQHAELMETSRCFQASEGQMTCTSCHDPHRKVPPSEVAAYYRQRCLQCHPSDSLSRHNPAQGSGDCTSCHMPRETPTNAGHTVFTNHRVGIYLKAAGDAPGTAISSAKHQLVFRNTGEQLSESEQHFFLGAAYLDAPLDELKTRPDYARQGVQEMERYLSGATSPEVSPLYRGRSEALLGKGYRALNQSDQALAHYQKSIRLDEAQLEPLYQLALLYAERGDAADSEAYFSRILRLFPDHVPSLHGLGSLAEAAGRPEAAVQYFEDAIRLFPGALSSHYGLAQVYLRQQRTDSALRELQSCLSLNPKYLPALMDLGHLFASQNRLAESLELFERALQLDSSREEIFSAISVVATLQGYPDEAIKVLQRAVTKGIAGEITWMNLGNLYAQREDFQQAIRFFSKASVKDPRNTKALLALGICYVRTGELAKGRSSLEQVLRLDPQNGEARQFLDQINGRPDQHAR